MKDAICQSPVLCWLNYESRREVILVIDTSLIAVRYILLQEGDDRKRYLNHFGSIGLSNVESCYSQAKLELYGLFRALQAVCIFVFGVNNFTVEVDAKYIQGMINNLDLQPNTTINWWIAGILLFSFHLIHIPATHHTGADRLSYHLLLDEDPPEEDDFEDWLDNSYSFWITLLNNHISLPMGDLLTSLDTCLVHYQMTVLYNLHLTIMPCLATWIHPASPPFSSSQTQIHTMTT